MITIEQTFFDPVPTGKYPARIVEIEESTGQFGPQLKFRFELPPEEDGEPRTLLGWTSQKFSTKSKLYSWTKAALGGLPIDRSYSWNSDDLIGKKVLITVMEKEGDEGVYNKIDALSPYDQEAERPTPPPLPEFEGNW